MSDLGVWLENQIKQRGLTLNATAVYSGVSAATLSDMMNKDHVPKVELLFKLADYFETPRNRVLELAGYLESEPKKDNHVDPYLRDAADRLIEIWGILQKLDPEAAERLVGIALVQAEAFEAAVRSSHKRQQASVDDNID